MGPKAVISAAATKSKILMLHGFAQSDRIFSAKTGGLRKTLQKLGYELYYPCAPEHVDRETFLALHSLPPDVDKTAEAGNKDIASKYNTSANSQDEMYGWWIRNPSGSKGLQNFSIKQSTFDYLHDYILQNGPFDGIIAFSQGAAFAGYLVMHFNRLLNLTLEEQPPLKFFVSFSGFKLEPDEYQNVYTVATADDVPPSLHILGEMDTVVSEERTMRLYNAYPTEKRLLLKHPGSHFIPNSKAFVTQLCNWLQTVTKSEAKESGAQEKHNSKSGTEEKGQKQQHSLDDDILGMMDSIGKL